MLKLKNLKVLLILLVVIAVIGFAGYKFAQKYHVSFVANTATVTQQTQNLQGNVASGNNKLAPMVNIEDVKLGDNAKEYSKNVDINYGFADLVEFAKPSVVNIMVVNKPAGATINGVPLESLDPLSREFLKRNMPEQENNQQRARGLGSGFIVRSDGFIVTNAHVVKDAEQIKVMVNEKVYDAQLHALDEATDIAVLKIEGSDFPALKFADSEKVRVGDLVVAIGSPFGLVGSVSSGIVSALGRNINAGSYSEFIQTDASINRGNSGGPLLNTKGEVIGINTSIFSPTGGNIGIGFAVPGNIAKKVTANLIANKKVVRSWLGVQIQPVDENVAKIYNLQEPTGALVSKVVKDSPAFKANIKVGDIIVKVDDVDITSNSMLPKLISNLPPESLITVEIIAKGGKKTLKVKLEAIPDAISGDVEAIEGENPNQNVEIKEDNYDDLGIRIAQIDDNIRKYFDLKEDIKGVVIISIKSGGLAEQKGLVSGLIITQINQEAIETLDKFKEVYNKYKTKGLLMLVEDLSKRSLFVSISAKELKSGISD